MSLSRRQTLLQQKSTTCIAALAALLEQMLQGGDRPHPELFVDLAHGLADEINNPLMFVSGHLQLLRASLDSKLKDSQRDQVDAALTGLKRIQAAVDRLRLLSEAANGPSGQEAADLGALVARAVAERNPGAETAKVTTPSEPQIVHGDREQLALAVDAIVQFADELSEAVTDCQLQLTQTESAYRLRVLASGQGLATWQLPKTFEPFYPQRLLRGQSPGLGLFLAQAQAPGPCGRATARPRPSGRPHETNATRPALHRSMQQRSSWHVFLTRSTYEQFPVIPTTLS